jgi:hypothetical protein
MLNSQQFLALLAFWILLYISPEISDSNTVSEPSRIWIYDLPSTAPQEPRTANAWRPREPVNETGLLILEGPMRLIIRKRFLIST